MCRYKDKSSIHYPQHATSRHLALQSRIQPLLLKRLGLSKYKGRNGIQKFQRLFSRMIFTFQLVFFYVLKSSQPSELIHLPLKNTSLSILCIPLNFPHDSHDSLFNFTTGQRYDVVSKQAHPTIDLILETGTSDH